jgi:hypothetical protein
MHLANFLTHDPGTDRIDTNQAKPPPPELKLHTVRIPAPELTMDVVRMELLREPARWAANLSIALLWLVALAAAIGCTWWFVAAGITSVQVGPVG